MAREGGGGQEGGDEEGLGGEGIMTDEVAGEQVMFISEPLSECIGVDAVCELRSSRNGTSPLYRH